MSQDVPCHFTLHTIKDLLYVVKGDMASVSHAASLTGGWWRVWHQWRHSRPRGRTECLEAGRCQESATFRAKIFMLWECKRIGWELEQSAELPLFFRIGIVVLSSQALAALFYATTWLKNFVKNWTGYQNFNFHKSSAILSDAWPHLLQSCFKFLHDTLLAGPGGLLSTSDRRV